MGKRSLIKDAANLKNEFRVKRELYDRDVTFKILRKLERQPWLAYCFYKREIKSIYKEVMRREASFASKRDDWIFRKYHRRLRMDMFIDVYKDYDNCMSLITAMSTERLKMLIYPTTLNTWSLSRFSNASDKMCRSVNKLSLSPEWWERFGLKYINENAMILIKSCLDDKINALLNLDLPSNADEGKKAVALFRTLVRVRNVFNKAISGE